ncbi:D-alanyl-D-alanine carboxypeptidase [Streptomyces tuirus]|uniref:serine-type D-Ala-D-Ala carboxypeptidase n=1 Tax=Streptomyces tuirus TaxID=68278 RepID=A0A941J509_9ACTN|nr:D-alanyl-D-alanine carboxypeptidase [Streptomyces tuirus]
MSDVGAAVVEPQRSAKGARGAGSSGGSDSAGSSESADSGRSSGSSERDDEAGAGDERLRDAVAAWVASADQGEEPAAAEDRDGRGKQPENADEDSQDAQDGQETAEGADEPTEADTDGQEAEKAAEAAETGTDARGGREADDGHEAGDGARPQDQPEAERAGADAETRADGRETDGTAKAAKDETRAQSQPQADKAGADGTAEDETRAQDQPQADKATQDAETRADDRKADGAEEAVEDEARGQGQPEGGKARAGARGDGAEADRSGGSGRAGAAGAGSEGGEDTPASAGVGTEDASKPGTPEDAPDTDTGKASESDGDSPTAPPVDQPTAVFKAVRPAVDQPTTMLKLGGAAKDAEKDSERTSKFVALKPLDDPSTRKPASSTPAGQAGPAAPADATAPVPTVGPERTTQQPLPPRPPLDLLAELTNTPPPPDTPLRTAVRRVKIWTPLVLLLVVLFAVVQSVRPLPAPTLELTAEDSYTFEGGKVDIPWPDKGQAALDVQGIGTFGSSGEQKPVPIASVAKVMTAYVILRDHPLKSGEDGPKIEIDQAAEDQSDAGQESTVDVTKGDKITQREALESILIASANNVARLLARWDAQSEKAFVRKMNQAAVDLGMKNTTYTDPSGLNNTTVSTAVDQVKLAKAAMQQPVFREVAAMMSYVDYKGTKHDNWNRLVGSNDVTGIKTGTTTSALGNLVFAAKKDVDGETRRIIGAVVRQPAGGPDNTILGAALYEGDQLIRAAQGALESATILKKGDVVGYADDGLGGRTPVVVTENVTAVGWAGLSVKLTFAPNDLPHEAKAGTKVGTLTVGDGTTSAVKVPVALQKDLVEPGFADKLTRLG